MSSLKVFSYIFKPKANIFNNADFGIVGEYADIIPELIERVKAGFKFGIESKKSNKRSLFNSNMCE